jgi:hypothetical protein
MPSITTRRFLLVLAIIALIAGFVVSRGRPDVVPGLSADIDPAPFNDSARDAVSASQVISAVTPSPAPETTSARPPNLA